MTGGTTPALPQPLTVLYQRAGLPAWPLPRTLAGVYGGDLGFRQPCLYANFVASIDGVTALGPEYPSSGSAISGHGLADRFVMGLLRACADVALIGAGTLRATPCHRWTPAHVCPAAAGGYAALRHARGLPADPLLAVVTARGDLPAADVLAAARDRGGVMVLTEGGPRLLGHLVAGGLLDELFLTISPVLAGRGEVPGPAWSPRENCSRAGQSQPSCLPRVSTGLTSSCGTRCVVRTHRTGGSPRRPGSRQAHHGFLQGSCRLGV